MSIPVLSIRGLKKTYDGKTFVLKGLDIEVGRGELVAVVGPSGAGKSTFIRCINRLIEPTSGEIIFEGLPVETAGGKQLRRIRCRIGMIFQHYNLIGRTSVIKNVLHGRLGKTPFIKSLFGLYTEKEKRDAEELLGTVGLAEHMNKKAASLSGGQMQRVGICRALMQQPGLLLADEPIASLDPQSAKTVMDCIKKMTTQLSLACIVNLHQVEFAKRFATRIIGLKDGQIIFDGAPEGLSEEMISYIYDSEEDEMPPGSGPGGKGKQESKKNVQFTDKLKRLLFRSVKRQSPPPRVTACLTRNPINGEYSGGLRVKPAMTLLLNLMTLARSICKKKAAAVLLAAAIVIFSFRYLDVSILDIFRSFPSLFRFFANNFFPPNFSSINLHLPVVMHTLLFAVVGTYISAILAFFLGILMTEAFCPLKPVRAAVRFLMSFLRNVPLLIWATIMVYIFGIGTIVGIMALVLCTLGFLARSYAESINDIASGRLEALRSGGAGYMQVLVHGLIPEFIPAWVDWTLFSFEINIRASAILGMVGAGGLGFLIQTSLDLRSYRTAFSLIIILVALVLITEAAVNYLRRFIDRQKNVQRSPARERLLGFIAAVCSVALFLICARLLNLDYARFFSRLANAGTVIPRFFVFKASALPEIISQLLISFALGICGLVIGCVISAVLAFLAADNIAFSKTVSIIIKSVVGVIRAVPSLVLILMVVASLGFGYTSGVVGLVFSSVGYLTRAFIGSIEQQDYAVIEAIRATGASRMQIAVNGLFPCVSNSFLSWISIRLENSVSDSISLGIVGVGGVGMLVSRAIRQHDFPSLSTTIAVIFTALFIMEIFVTHLRKKLT